MHYVVDTHALVWHLALDRRLGSQARQVLENKNAQLIIPAIVLAEAKHIADRNRVPMSFQQILEHVTSSINIEIFPMDVPVIELLPDNHDIHDAIIVATALHCKELFEEDVAILTNDISITESGLVPTIW